MASNHLEDLLAEWYEYRGFFIRRNVLVGKRPNGGYECELDVVAFNPSEKRLVHLEPSLDASSWQRREERFAKKFAAGRKYIPELFRGLDLPKAPEQFAVLVFASGINFSAIGGAKIIFAGEIVGEILTHLRQKRLAKSAVPEQYPILRTLQYVAEYRTHVINSLASQ